MTTKPRKSQIQTSKSNATTPNGNGGLQRVETQSWSGPIPPPKALNDYNSIVPGAAERILRLAELEQESRHIHDRATERILEKDVTQKGSESFRGQVIGAVLIVVSLGLAFASAYLGFHPTVSVAFIAIPIVSAINAVINRGGKK